MRGGRRPKSPPPLKRAETFHDGQDSVPASACRDAEANAVGFRFDDRRRFGNSTGRARSRLHSNLRKSRRRGSKQAHLMTPFENKRRGDAVTAGDLGDASAFLERFRDDRRRARQ